MAWCDDCNRHSEAEELGEGDTCPGCGQVLDTTKSKAPWHFKLLLGSLTIYLGWRSFQGVAWLLRRF